MFLRMAERNEMIFLRFIAFWYAKINSLPANTYFILYPDEVEQFERKLAKLKVKENARVFIGGNVPLV